MIAICPGCISPIGYNTDHDCQRSYLDDSYDRRVRFCECACYPQCAGHKPAHARTPGVTC